MKLPGFALTAIAGLYTFFGAITGKQFPLTLDMKLLFGGGVPGLIGEILKCLE